MFVGCFCSSVAPKQGTASTMMDDPEPHVHDVELNALDPEKQPVTGGGQRKMAALSRRSRRSRTRSTGYRSADGGLRQLRVGISFDFCQCGLTTFAAFQMGENSFGAAFTLQFALKENRSNRL